MLQVSYAPEPGSYQAVAELISLALIIASFAIVVYAVLKVRRRRSLQFELFLFAVVLVAAEIPRTLYSLGFVDLDALDPIGLGIHSVSMVVLTSFLAYRTFGFFKGKGVMVVPGDRGGLIMKCAQDSLSEALGETTMKAMTFYVDLHLLVTDPSMYDSQMRKILGLGADAVESLLMDKICMEFGFDRKGVTGIEQVISKAKGLAP